MYLPSASNILGMSRYFSATSKALFRLVTGSSLGREEELCQGQGTEAHGNKAGREGSHSGREQDRKGFYRQFSAPRAAVGTGRGTPR